MADFQSILTDPDFRAASPETKREILSANDADFAGSSRETQDSILRGMSAEIKPPPTIGDYIVGAAKTVVGEALPILGMVAGGLIGAPAGPLPAAAGGVLGYAGGKQANRVISSMLPSQSGQYVAQPPLGLEPAPSGVMDTLGKIGQDIVTGAAMEAVPVVGRGIVSGVKGLLGVGGLASSSDLAVRAAAAKHGVTLPAGAASESSGVARMEAIPAQFPVGRQTTDPINRKIQKEAEAAAGRLNVSGDTSLEQAGTTVRSEIRAIAKAQENAPTQLVDDFIGAIGGVQKSRAELGGQIRASGETIERARRLSASRAYADVATSEQLAADIPLARTREVSSAISGFERRLTGVQNPVAKRAEGLKRASSQEALEASDLPPEARAELMRTSPGSDLAQIALEGGRIPPGSLSADFIDRYGLTTTGTRTLEEAIAIQQRLRGLARNATDDVTRRQLRQLIDAVSDDIGSALPGTALADAARQYKNEVAVYFARQAPLRKLLGKEPSRVADQLLAAPSTERLAELVKIFPKEDIADVRRAVLDRIKQKSVSLSTGEVSPDAFESQLKRFGEDNLRLIFGDRSGMLDKLRATLKSNFGRDTSSRSLAALLEASPEKIVPIMAKGAIKSLDNFDAAWDVLSPVARQEIRGALYQDVLRESVDTKTGIFSIERFLSRKDKVPQEIWDRVMGQNQSAALKDLELVFRRLHTFARIAANPSQTAGTILGQAQALGTAAAGGALTMSTVYGNEDPASFARKSVGIIAALLAPTIFGKTLFSGPAQRALTTPAVRPPYTMSPAGLFYRTGAAAAASQTNE